MKYWQTALSILAPLCASLALADDFKTINGKEYKNATISRVEADGIVIRTKAGISKVYFTELPKEVADKWLNDPVIAAQRAAEQKRIEAQNAAERERAEKEKNADADLKHALEQFQSAEQRAAQSYGSARKGALSGQIFVSTRGGQNFKLGAVQVSLVDRDAIDALISAAKIYADIKIQQLRPSEHAAWAAYEQAQAAERAAFDVNLKSIGHNDHESARRAWDEAVETANRASDQHLKASRELEYYHSGGFYFSLLHSPLQTAETDGDGKFVVEVPQTGKFIIAAQAQRNIGDDIEHYYWLQPVSLEGQPQLTQNLSNNNLTSTTGTSALILTKD